MITSLLSRQAYAGTGSTGPFGFTFKIFNPATDLKVTKLSALGAETPLAYLADYTVVGIKVGVDAYGGGGTITLNVALAVGESLTIRRVPPNVQGLSVQNAGPFFPKGYEDQLDYLVMLVQAHEDVLQRAVRLKETSTLGVVDTTLPQPVASAVITWADNGTSLQSKILDATGSVGIPGFGRTVATVTDYVGNNQIFDPRDWLAVANGAADDGAKIQSAHDAAVANNGEMILSRGTYRGTGNRTLAGGLTIRRGAKLKVGAASTYILGPLNAGHYQAFDISEGTPGFVQFSEGALTEVKAEWFGWSPSATGVQNRNALRWAIAALPPAGGIVTLGKGTFNVDVNDVDGGVRILRSNVTIRGAGMKRTTILYSSASADGGYGRGSVFVVNVSIITTYYDDINFEDMTLQDTSTTQLSWVGHNPSAIDGQGVINHRTSRVEFIDVKGNGCHLMLGDSTGVVTPGTGDCIVEDCVFRGTIAGGGVQRDAINAASFNRIYIRRNRVLGNLGGGLGGGHAFEFGTGIGELYVLDNVVDMGGVGDGCVASFTIIRHGRIAGNSFLNWSNLASAIPINPDISTQPVNGLVIESNRFVSSISGQSAVGVQDGVVVGLIVRSNYFECGVPISFAKIPQGQVVVTKNQAKWTGFGNVFLVNGGGAPAFVNSTDTLEISFNNLQGRTDLRAVDFGTFAVLKDGRVRGLHTNIIQNPQTGQIDGQFYAPSSINSAVANGSDSGIFSVTVPGALLGDAVKIRKRLDGVNAAPDGVVYHGWVSAADTVKFFYHNNSGAAYGAGPVNMDVIITLERS